MDNESKKLALLNASEDKGIEIDPSPRGVIFEILRDGKIAYVSTGLETVTGYKSYEVIGKDILEFLDLLLGKNYSKQLVISVSEVLRGSRKALEADVQAYHKESSQKKLYSLQLEGSTENFNRAILLLSDQKIEQKYKDELDEINLRSMKVLDHGRLVIINSDTELKVNEIFGNTQEILGVSSKLLLDNPTLWTKLLNPEDYKSLSRKVYRLNKKPKSFEKELRFMNPKTRQYRWILFSAVPVIEKGLLVGWEGFGIDITSKKKAGLELAKEKARYNALYNLTTEVQSQQEPAMIALKGLNILMEATSSFLGAVCLYEESKKDFEIAAVKGLSETQLDFLNKYITKKNNIISSVFKDGNSIIIGGEDELNRYNIEDLSTRINEMSIVPLCLVGGEEANKVVGVVVLATKQKYTQNEMSLIVTAANQMALICKQADYILSEKKQADSINILYNLGHQLTKALSPQEIADSSLPIIHKELDCKRVWMGVLNSRGSHINGVSGYGSGMRQAINHVQIEIARQHDFFDTVIKTKKSVIFKYGSDVKCSGLQKVLNILQPETLVVIPMISIGQMVGVLVVEPNSSELAFKNKIPLLTSIANEMATAILSKKYEEQLAQSQKMRMAGMLSSGIAHNFNNLLQAIMGQASLIDSQLEEKSSLKKSVELILNSAEKGAQLIKKMSTMVQTDVKDKKKVSINSIIEESKEFLNTIITPKHKITYNIASSEHNVLCDSSKIQQIITSLVVNAKDAIEKAGIESGEINVKVTNKNMISGEVDPELAPGSYVRIDVTDNGYGMTQEEVKRCFEPFFTTKNFDESTGVGYTGSGLGLSNAYSIIKKHNGMILADSIEGKGSIFSIYLPLYREKSEKNIKEYQKGIEKYQAIIVGDNYDIHPSILAMLSNLDFNILQLHEVEQVENYYSIEAFIPDVLILNLDNEASDIVDRIKELKSNYSNVNIIGYTASVKKWSSLLRFFEKVKVLEAPLSIIELNRALKEVVSKNTKKSLIDKIEIERTKDSRMLRIGESIKNVKNVFKRKKDEEKK